VAAGNNGKDLNSYPVYPAAYRNLPNKITVGASSYSNTIAGFSNYGTLVDLVAPGVSIYNTYYGSYTYMSGTSMATPVVAGVAALIKMQHPEYATSDLKSKVIASTDKVLLDKCINGKINAYAAVNEIFPTPTVTPTPTPTVIPTAIPTSTPIPTPTNTPTPTPTITPTPTPTQPPWSEFIADFTAITPTSGKYPLVVSFKDRSVGNPIIWNWAYSKNNGPFTLFSTSQHVRYQFTSPGKYTIRLVIMKYENGISRITSVTKQNFVTVTY